MKTAGSHAQGQNGTGGGPGAGTGGRPYGGGTCAGAGGASVTPRVGVVREVSPVSHAPCWCGRWHRSARRQRGVPRMGGKALPLSKLIELGLGHCQLEGLLLGQLWWLDLRVDDG
jgi:hypothetical protein